MINKNFVYAIVGASNNPAKYGHIVLKDLLSGGFNVIPVNLIEEEILKQKAYSTLSEIPQKIDVVIFVVPPKVTLNVLNEVKDLGIKKVWMQPGSESPASIKFCEENDIECTFERCIMVDRRF